MNPVWRSVGQWPGSAVHQVYRPASSRRRQLRPGLGDGPMALSDCDTGTTQLSGRAAGAVGRQWHRSWGVRSGGAPLRGAAAVRSLSAPVLGSNGPAVPRPPCGFLVQHPEHSPGATSAKLICRFPGTACKLHLGRSDTPTLRSACSRHFLTLTGVLPGEGNGQRAFAVRAASHRKRPRTIEGPAISPPPSLPARAPETGMRSPRGRRARLHAR